MALIVGGVAVFVDVVEEVESVGVTGVEVDQVASVHVQVVRLVLQVYRFSA